MASDRDARTKDGARDTVALLTALHSGDIVGAEAIINHADPAPTMAALASAWLSLVDFFGGDAAQLIASMRSCIDAE